MKGSSLFLVGRARNSSTQFTTPMMLSGSAETFVNRLNELLLEMTKQEKPMLIITNNSQDKLDHLKEIRNMSQFAYTPIICLFTKAGLVIGPNILKTVLTPNCLLTGIAYFIAG